MNSSIFTLELWVSINYTMLMWKLGFYVNDTHGIVTHLIWAQIKGRIGKLVDRKHYVYLIRSEKVFFVLFNQRLKCVFIFMKKIKVSIHIVHFERKAWINYCHIFQHTYWDFSFFYSLFLFWFFIICFVLFFLSFSWYVLCVVFLFLILQVLWICV